MSRDDFLQELERLFSDAEKQGKTNLTVRAGDLHHLTGDYPGPNHRMPVCCSVMRSVRVDGNEIIQSPPKGGGFPKAKKGIYLRQG
jgi:5-methylcytosine-specific restriction protein A